MTTFPRLEDGEGLIIKPEHRAIALECCDCGLQHRGDITRKPNGNIEIRFRRWRPEFDNEITFDRDVTIKHFKIPCRKNENYRLPKGTEPTKIIAAAILHKGRIWTGRRHYELIAEIQSDIKERVSQDEQGFYTNDYRFVSRAAAATIAINAGQLPETFDKALLSEHLW